MYIRRNITDVLQKRAKNSMCLLITGPRQIGKSTILKKNYDDNLYLKDDLVVLPIEYL